MSTNSLVTLASACIILMVATINCYPINEQEQPFANAGDMFVHDMGRDSDINGFEQQQQQQQQYQQEQQTLLMRQRRQQPMSAPGSDPTGGLLAGLNNLAQQAQTMTQAQQLFQSAQSLFQPSPKQQSNPFAALTGTPQQTPVESTVKSALDTAQTTSQSAISGASQTAQNAQVGMRSALTELSTGLQRIAQNNPNLLPDVKGLYQRVSTQLSAASPAVQSNPLSGKAIDPNQITSASGPSELVDNLAKAAVPSLQTPAQQSQAGISNLLQSFSG